MVNSLFPIVRPCPSVLGLVGTGCKCLKLNPPFACFIVIPLGNGHCSLPATKITNCLYICEDLNANG